MDIAARAKALAQPLAGQLGLALWDVRFLKEGAQWYLRFWIDKPGGVDLDDCEAMSRALDKPLDDADFIPQSYHLEVCSPGVERELTRDEHFAQYIGERVTAKRTYPPQEIVGVLEGYADKRLTLRLDGGETLEIEKKACAWVKLYDTFEEEEEDE
ncbi:MAG: ribosome maturation factor RimP [Oscillospiraceae bacterium]|jgi:ribosome maturation factor RimP|nr:ribosome maturation factor RimP [Oscillospiraceae bacterium]